MSGDVHEDERRRWRRVDEILAAVLDLPAADRAAAVATACGADTELRREVLDLLSADAEAGSFLEPSSRGVEGTGTSAAGTRAQVANGTVLAGRYRVDDPLGHGGMGVVYRAHDLVLRTDVAVKMLDPRVLARHGRMDAFRREVRLARLVTHPNVCRVHDIVESDALVFITMEYVAGQSLAERLRDGTSLPLAAGMRVLADVARGLAAAHAAGVIHRDLKPGNVLLRHPTGEAVVADFGVAAEATSAADGELRGGTRGYMAPEQAAGAPPDVASDLYSLGVLAYRIATGRMPGDDANARELPPALRPLVEACLRREPRERPASAALALALLERTMVRRRRTRLAVVTLVALALTAGWWTRARLALTHAGRDLAVAVSDTSRLDAAEAWLGNAWQGRLVDELIDAWSLEARAAPADAPPAAAVRSQLWREASGRLRASVVLPGGGAPLEVPAGSLRELAERAARHIVERYVPAAARHPTAQQLREVGARDPEAWRQFRRAQRAARMEQWARVRALAQDAVRRDPSFCRAWQELDLTYDREDQARLPILDKVIEYGDQAVGLSPFSRQAVEFARQSRRQDAAGMAQALRDLAALELQGDDLLYLKTRLATAYFAQGEPETGLPLVEWIAENWPHDAAAHRKLADYYAGDEEPVSLPLALRHGERAVALAPDDVAARANLARALLLHGDERAARAHLAVIDLAEPADKQAAFLEEHVNRLFALHMLLGDVEDAAADARRLGLGLDPGLSQAQSQAALAAVASSRGAFEDGLAGLWAAIDGYERLRVDAMAQLANWQYAWQAHTLGRDELVRAAAERAQRMEPPLRDSSGWKYARRTQTLANIGRLATGGPDQAPALAALRRELDEAPTQGEWGRWRAYLELLIRYRQRDWAGVVAAYRELEKPAPALAVTYEAADACERLGHKDEAARLFERLATDPNAWYHPYRRGQAWARLGRLREQKGDAGGAQQAYESLLRLWDRARRNAPEIVHAEQRLQALHTAAKR